MYSTVLSAAVHGLEVQVIHVETDISNGLPMFDMVGYLSSEVKEAGARVRTAIKNSGYAFPAKKVVVNLSPADVRKKGASFDLPIAVSLLVSLGEIKKEAVQDILFIGELGLNGEIRHVPGILPIIIEAEKMGYRSCIVPIENAAESVFNHNIKVFGVSNLEETVEYLNGRKKLKSVEKKKEKNVVEENLDYADIRGQKLMKRAVEIAVAGNHNILFIGPPGAGKTLIAQRIPTIFPPLSEEECIEVTKIYSILGLTDENHPMMEERPFRSPHHTSTKAALIGGGVIPNPGEISMAHHGVLFLDELPEFKRQVLDSLRQPIEERKIHLTRKSGVYTFPCNFMLVAAMNPCPCGYYPDRNKCCCTQAQIRQYRSHVTGPFLDRIDLCVEAPRIEYEELYGGAEEESSKQIRERVCNARKFQKERYQRQYTNAELTIQEMKKYCSLDKEGEQFMKAVYEKMNLTARTSHKVLKVARTIADLEESRMIKLEHLKEAVSYRIFEEQK